MNLRMIPKLINLKKEFWQVGNKKDLQLLKLEEKTLK